MTRIPSRAAHVAADRVLRRGIVHGRGGGVRLAALALSGGRILAAGNEAAVMAFARPGAEIVDLDGAPLIA